MKTRRIVQICWIVLVLCLLATWSVFASKSEETVSPGPTGPCSASATQCDLDCEVDGYSTSCTSYANSVLCIAYNSNGQVIDYIECYCPSPTAPPCNSY
jgi:hypothetical protein